MDYSYTTEFQNALEFTRKMNFNVPNFSFRDRIYWNFNTRDKIEDILTKELAKRRLKVEDLALQCLKVSYLLSRPISQILRCKVIVTLGYVIEKAGKTDLYRFSEDDVKNWINNPSCDYVRNVHAWLTLDSGEVLDLTLLTSIAVVKQCDGFGAFFCGRPEDPAISLEYYPIVVGREIVEQAFCLVNL